MKNSFGSAFHLTLFGESHGPAVGVVIDGIAPGIRLDESYIDAEMQKRRAVGATSTSRREPDLVEYLSGVYDGYTTGAPLCIIVKNTNTRSKDYLRTAMLMRPGHADYTAHQKYLGFNDLRGGGHFSARLTAPIVAAGALCRMILAEHGVTVGSHISRCGGYADSPLPMEEEALREALFKLRQMQFPVLNEEIGENMRLSILQARTEGDSIGGIIEAAATGLPAGLGEPFFESVESVLSTLFYSIPGVKGVEFGIGFGFAGMQGSTANDPFYMDGDGKVRTRSNNNGGINGGITNGMPLSARLAFKPTPSIEKMQNTIDITKKEDAKLELKGRHDPCILPRARAVVDAMLCIGLVDLFTVRYGTLWQCGGEAFKRQEFPLPGEE